MRQQRKDPPQIGFCKELPFFTVLLAWVLSCNVSLAANVPVTMSGFSFTPNDLTINVGDTVTWTVNQGFHDTVSGSSGVPSGIWNSNDQYHRLMRPGDSFSFTFNGPGTFPFYCTPHWTFGMVGTIRVVAPNSPPSVSILSPQDGANLSAPADINVLANAFDSDGSVTRVEFFMNGSSIGVVLAPPYSVSVTNLGPGNYTFAAVATDNAGATGNASVSVAVSGQQPTITSAPQPQTVSPGSDVVFNVQARGSPPLSYQWFFGSAAIAGATGTSLLLTNVSSAESGIYSVQVSNAFGFASAFAMLTVTNPPTGPPTITTQPQSQMVSAGTNVTFMAAAISSSPFNWQWFFNAAPIAGETNSMLLLSNVTTASAGEYFAVAANDFGASTSSVAILMVTVPPVCEFALSKTGASFAATGGVDSVAVSTGAECSWTNINTNAWIFITPGNGGLGPRTVIFTVLSNTSRVARTGILLIAGQVFTVTQSGVRFDVKNDFDRDGNTDFLWQNVDGRVRLWLMNGVTPIRSLLLRNGMSFGPGWRIVGTHDFNLDGNVDILWQHAEGSLAVWFMNGTNLVRTELISGAPALGRIWRLTGLGDFNQDGHADFLFRHRDGYLLLWVMKRTRFIRQSFLYDGEPISTEWRVVGIGNVDKDEQPDILWQNADSSVVVWFMNGMAPLTGPLLSNLPRLDARIVGVNDLNQDGKLDFIWRHRDGHLSVWWMDGTNRVGTAVIDGGKAVPATWSFVAPKN